MSTSNDKEIVKKMQDVIRKKHLKKGEDAEITLDDGTNVKIFYEEDK